MVDTVDDGSIIEGGNVTVGDTVDDGNIDTVDEDDDRWQYSCRCCA